MAWTAEEVLEEVNKLAHAVEALAGVVATLATPDYVREEIARIQERTETVAEATESDSSGTGTSSGGSSASAEGSAEA